MHGPCLHHHLETEMTAADRRRIALRIGGMLFAAAMLVAGLVHRALFPDMRAIASLILALGALVACAPVIVEGLRAFLRRDERATLEQLVGLALLASLAAGEFETAILIPLLLAIGHALEDRSIRGARAAIEGLKKLTPNHAFRRTRDEDGTAREERVDATALAPGDVLVVRPGEVFPADGVVRTGVSAVDQSSMTGESVAVEVSAGAEVYAGTINLSGLVDVEVTGVAEKSALGRIVDLLHQAEHARTPIMKVIEKYAAFYLPAVLVLAAAVLVFTGELSRAVTILVVSCPCALVVASPAAMTAALAVAARLGILIKNTRFLEAAGDVDTLVLDKTGTITVGELEVVGVSSFNGVADDDLLRDAAAVAHASRHPVSRAVVGRAEALEVVPAEGVEEIHGRGLVGRIGGREVRIGSKRWLDETGIETPALPDHVGPVVYVARDRRAEGVLLLADTPRASAADALAALRALDVRRALLVTGDRREVAEAVAVGLELDRVEAECLPERKLELVREEHGNGRRVMMVGDGVNDALALAEADVGVAMGAIGSAVAVESADVALMTNELGRLPEMVRLSRRTRANIHQNVFIAIFSSLGMMALASFGLISPIIGAAVHNVGTFAVIFNSARLLRD